LGLVASSSEAMRLLELFELQAQEGPCLDAFRTGERIEHENLAAGSGRWPSFSVAALGAGFQSAFALPLRLRDVALGALKLFSVTQTPMDEADVIVARAFADLATLSIVRRPKPSARTNSMKPAELADRVLAQADVTRADLIVIGGHHLHELREKVLGDIGKTLSHRARCPVLLMPSAVGGAVR